MQYDQQQQGGGGAASPPSSKALAAANNQSMISAANKQQQSPPQQQQQQLQWTNLTPFLYQREIARVAEAMGLSRRFGHLQDRVIFFRPNVRRKCPNGIMTERVVFITPNGLLHLCDNDAAPKRTLALTELLSIVTDSVSQIALITDWPLVLRFETPRSSASLPAAVQQLPTLKNLISLVKFFRPNASLLRCTPEDFSTVSLNLGKPRQFRAPASFDALLPPPDKSLAEAMNDSASFAGNRDQYKIGGGPLGASDDGTDLLGKMTAKGAASSLFKNMQNKIRTAAASAQGSPLNSPKRSVQFSGQNQVAVIDQQQEQQNLFPSNQQQQQQQRMNNNNAGGAGSFSPPGSPFRRPDAPTSQTDFWAAQQNALYDQYTVHNMSPGSAFNQQVLQHQQQQQQPGGSPNNNQQQQQKRIIVDPKVDKMFSKQPSAEERAKIEQEIATKKRRTQIVEFDRDGNLLPEKSFVGSSSSENTPSRGNYNNIGEDIESRNVQGSGYHRNNNNNNAPPVPPAAIKLSGNLGLSQSAPNFGQQQQPPVSPLQLNQNRSLVGMRRLSQQPTTPLQPEQQQHQQDRYPFRNVREAFNNQNNNDQQKQNYQDLFNPFNDQYFETLPEKFAEKTGKEINIAVEAVKRLEIENDFLRREVLELKLREKRMTSDPIPLGRVLPAEAALAGAAVRNLGILVTSICRRRKQLNQLATMMTAQQSLLEGNSMMQSGSNMFGGDVDDGEDPSIEDIQLTLPSNKNTSATAPTRAAQQQPVAPPDDYATSPKEVKQNDPTKEAPKFDDI